MVDKRPRINRGHQINTGENPNRDGFDFYATCPEATRALLSVVIFKGPIWECASGQGHITKVLEDYDMEVISTDLYAERYEFGKTLDFLETDKPLASNVITNPPYKLLNEFIDQSLKLCLGTVALLTPLQAVASRGRLKLFLEHGHPDAYVLSPTIKVPKIDGSVLRSAFSHVWLVWEKRYRANGKFKILDWRKTEALAKAEGRVDEK